jgi:hypothetical protein
MICENRGALKKKSLIVSAVKTLITLAAADDVTKKQHLEISVMEPDPFVSEIICLGGTGSENNIKSGSKIIVKIISAPLRTNLAL